MRTPKVFVIQNHLCLNSSGELVPKYDLSPALEHGELVTLLDPAASPFHPAYAILELQTALSEYTSEDSLLLVGNPLLIGLAFAIAASKTGGRVKALQWNGRSKKYIPIHVTELFSTTTDYRIFKALKR